MTNEKIKSECEKNYLFAREIRREIHKHPELGRKEYRTTEYIGKILEELKIPYEKVLETGLVGIIEGEEEGKTTALRADIDALPIHERTESEFKSQNEGIMHACGHDFHTAALLGAAKIINENKSKLKGRVKLIFQPDEEGDGGAKRLCEKGVLDDVDEVYGIHVRPEYKSDIVAVKYGKSYAASDMFEIEIRGKSGHGAEPHKSIDTIVIAAQIVSSIQTIVSRTVDPIDSAVITIGTIKGGTVRNIVAGKCELSGIIRSLGKETRMKLRKQLKDIAEGISNSMGAECEVRIIESYPGIVNHDEQTEYIEKCAADIFTREKTKIIESPGMVTEDFGYYLEKAKGCFYHVGCDSEYILHSDKFNPDEKALKTMMIMHVKSVFG